MTVTICWFRRNLRLADNAALCAAAANSTSMVPLFVHRDIPLEHGPGTASLAWLRLSLNSLHEDLRTRGSRLVVRTGLPAIEIARIAAETGARRVHCQRDWTPSAMAEESAARDLLASEGIEFVVSEGQLLIRPDAVATAKGAPYRVFTPFYNEWRSQWRAPPILGTPDVPPCPSPAPAGGGPLSVHAGAPDVARWWPVGESGAHARMREFAETSATDYAAHRDSPGVRGTSELSPRLSWGELSIAHVLDSVSALSADVIEPFIRQLAWREFAHHMLHHHPTTLDEPLRERFSAFPLCRDARGVDAWQRGATGYPLVDAGMRQLTTTGWMHNRVRLVCGSFLVKDLLQPWQTGASHFGERLVDYDPAANAFNWQWIAGCGADASPFFRIFNPVLQATRHDSDGDYVRRGVPELSKLPNRWIHQPWAAPESILADAGVSLDTDYPRPIIDHAEARARALAAFRSLP
jgi:deoxyribodipyrimidine photo-lyase